MISLPPETEALAYRLAAAQHLPVETTIRRALEDVARSAGVGADDASPRRRMNVDLMLAVGSEIAAMPILDARSPREIMDDLDV